MARQGDPPAAAAPLVFISHAGEDTWVARQVAASIEACGARTFLDVQNLQIVGATGLDERIEEAIREASELVVLATPWSLDRPWVWVEIALAHFRRPACPIIVLLQGQSRADFQGLERVPAFLKAKDIMRLNDIDRYLEDLRSRVRGIDDA
jgi:hypothetical protein